MEANALTKILYEAKGMKADHLLLLFHGEPLIDWSSRKYHEPYQLMSVTKSICSLAVGPLFDGDRVRLEDTLDKYFPELRRRPQGRITIEQVLHQTSGLSHKPLGFEADDYVMAALGLPLLTPPGSEYHYNNVAVQILSGLVERVTGDTLEAYVREHLFAPLGITAWDWEKDTAGHSYVAAFLSMGPHDLGKIGQLIAQKGVWNGNQVISAKWVAALRQPSKAWPFYGLLWWVGFSDNWFQGDNRPKDAHDLLWANGASNQILAVVPRNGLVLVVQTEDDRRPAGESQKESGNIEPILRAFLNFSELK